MKGGSHTHEPDKRNETVRISINGAIVPRAEAMVSVFDSGFLLGDGVWEGIRLHNGRLLFEQAHIDRLYEGAKAIDIDLGMTKQQMSDSIYAVCAANDMTSGVHIRLVVSRGLKSTPYQSPSVNIGGPTVAIIPEWKAPDAGAADRMLKVFTVHVRRGYPDVQDPMLNSLSKLNCITACIQAQKAGADEALMLDPHGFVATCNSTHFFIVRGDELWTSTGRYCLKGITRDAMLRLADKAGLMPREKDFSLTEVYSADEAFLTGTFAGLLPVGMIDGRIIGDGRRGVKSELLQTLYADLVEQECPAA